MGGHYKVKMRVKNSEKLQTDIVWKMTTVVYFKKSSVLGCQIVKYETVDKGIMINNNFKNHRAFCV